ncbi:MAG: NAD(P)/FAD-dependent oxidoreductase [Chloroflexi bacterium]|nr:NAD(P)/FAD-dependent oxidoreductase [Chloroflexota bacterium]
MERDRSKVVIVGAGFGGLWAAKALRHTAVDVTLIDRNNYHTFFPLLYQVGAAELAPDNIAKPVRSILRKIRNANFLMTEVTDIDLDSKTVFADHLSIPYDYLILATGSVTNYFGVPGAADHAFPLRTLQQGVNLRNHILVQFEKAVSETDPEVRKRRLTFAVVGGGPTGVEFSGALSELVHGPLRRDIPTLNMAETKVILFEATGSLLPGLPERLRDYTLKRLSRLNVDVQLHSTVSNVSSGAVELADGTVIFTETVVWTAGVRGGETESNWGIPTGKGGRIRVLPSLQIEGRPEVSVVGDLAEIDGAEKEPPMVAPAAVQQGATAALNIRRHLAGAPILPFRYRDRGAMAVIGRNAAVAHLFNRWQLIGFLGWITWLAVHLYQLIGFRNRLVVLINWGWSYVFLDRALRLIFPPHKHMLDLR